VVDDGSQEPPHALIDRFRDRVRLTLLVEPHRGAGSSAQRWSPSRTRIAPGVYLGRLRTRLRLVASTHASPGVDPQRRGRWRHARRSTREPVRGHVAAADGLSVQPLQRRTQAVPVFHSQQSDRGGRRIRRRRRLRSELRASRWRGSRLLRSVDSSAGST
jgi:hypothetical protein